MAKHNTPLEAYYRFTPASVNHYWLKITFADYDTGELKGDMQGYPFISASYSRESAPSTKSSLFFRVNYRLWDPEAPGPNGTKGNLTVRTGKLNLMADDHSYNTLYGNLQEDGSSESIGVTLTKSQ
ncbi:MULTISPECIES: hypothetical protein [Pseudomonas]|uniref:Uncharacterized protein n=1 Tax=Pseudomonas synxantha TaxID=47883 RepID=A0A5D3G0Z6_9PSED|nr:MULTISPECIES: hypothetical protein [Pseudomonas]MCK3826987.1 hypothetical protein [Pseudomonas sp. W2Aug9]TYK53720.1 hypothetical protein FXO26_31145 [Pseudomonas synxantha]TYK54156.1 hypothetical protein FXO26_28795 [Pseudomonas synxantha]